MILNCWVCGDIWLALNDAQLILSLVVAIAQHIFFTFLLSQLHCWTQLWTCHVVYQNSWIVESCFDQSSHLRGESHLILMVVASYFSILLILLSNFVLFLSFYSVTCFFHQGNFWEQWLSDSVYRWQAMWRACCIRYHCIVCSWNESI